MKKGDEVWVYIHEMKYITIYKGTLLSLPDESMSRSRSMVYYTDVFFDNDRDLAVTDTTRSVNGKHIYSSFEAMVDAMDKQRVIRDILDSKKVAKR